LISYLKLQITIIEEASYT